MELVCEEVPNGFLATVSYTQQKTGTKTEVTEKLGEKGPEKLTVNQRKILDCIAENQYITREELVILVGISLSKIKENISKLKAKGLL
jgi:predicted HTH transcriptional regulator